MLCEPVWQVNSELTLLKLLDHLIKRIVVSEPSSRCYSTLNGEHRDTAQYIKNVNHQLCVSLWARAWWMWENLSVKIQAIWDVYMLKWTSYPWEYRKRVREPVNSLKSNSATDHCSFQLRLRSSINLYSICQPQHSKLLACPRISCSDGGSIPPRSTRI